MKVIVGLHGLPRAGKDTLGAELVARGFKRIGFADAVYEEVAETFNVSVEDLQGRFKQEPTELLASWRAQDPDYRALACSLGDKFEHRNSRFHTRIYATEYRRKQNPAYWTDIVQDFVEMNFREEDFGSDIVVTDVRFPNEVGMLRQTATRLGYAWTLIEITRDGVVGSEHVSDTRLDGMIDTTIHNEEGNPAALINQAVAHIARARISGV